jgi:YVTN family beta-propeller protein
MLLAALSLIGVIATPGIAHAVTGVVTTNFAYVANSQNNTVAVVNLSTNSVVDTISGFSQPEAMAASPNGQYVYVANYFGNTVSVISTATNSVVATIAVGGSPSGIAVTPNGQYLYVSNLTGDGSGSSTDPLATSVSVISTATNSVVTTIGLYESGPAGLAMSPAGDYVYVANDLSASISIISTATNTVVQTFTNLPAPNSTTFNPVSVGVEPDGKYVYFGEANYGQYIGLLSVSSSGPSSDTFSILGGVYTQQIAGFAFNSTTALAIQGNFSSSAEYFPWGHTAISPAASVAGLANPSAVAVSPDGSTFYVTNANNSTVSVVPASSISSNTNGLVYPSASIQVGYGATLDGIVVVSITKNTNTITVSSSAPTNAVVGGATYTPQASATSGDSIVVSLDGTSSGCVVHSGVVSFLTVGTCVLDFTDPGNASYVAATTSQSFSIGKGTPIIGVYTPAPGNAVVGGATYTPQATSTSSDSVTVSLDPTSTGCALNSGVVSFTGVGTCVVDFTDAGNANYVSATSSQSFTVSAAPIIPFLSPVSDLLSGISASGQAIVTWRAPATSGGVSVISYEVQESINHGVTWTSSPLTQITGTKAVIRGLSTTASYEFRVLTTGSQATQSVSTPVVTVALTVHDLSLPLEPFVAFHSSLRLKKGGRADAIRLLEEMDAVGYHTLVITGYAIYSPSSPRHPGLTMSQVEALARSRGEMVARFFDILDAQLHLPRLHLRVEVDVHSGKKGLSNFDLFRRVELRF